MLKYIFFLRGKFKITEGQLDKKFSRQTAMIIYFLLHLAFTNNNTPHITDNITKLMNNVKFNTKNRFTTNFYFSVYLYVYNRFCFVYIFVKILL